MIKIEKGKTNKILRTVSEEIKSSDIKKYSKLGEEMVKYIKNPDNGGVGLAAPQVGINIRLIAVSLLKNRDDENYKTIYMINPEIIEKSEEMELDQEGCLSIVGERGDVLRYKEIKLKYLDGKGKENILVLKRLSARIVQHEIDHLDGVLFTDKIVGDILKVRR